MALADMNLRCVDKFFLVQADGFEENDQTIVDEKEFNNLQDALRLMKKSEAPVKYLKFNYEGCTYKLYPDADTEEYTVVKLPIIN